MAPAALRAAMTGGRTAIALVAAVAGVFVAVQLGNWQNRRAEQKLALERAWAEAAAAPALDVHGGGDLQAVAARLPRRVRLRGEFLHQHTVWLDNRMLDGRVGFLVVTPLRLRDASGIVLIARGWAARDLADPTRLPPVGRPAGAVELEGLAVSGVPRLPEFGRPPPDRGAPIRQNLELDEFRARLELPVATFVVQQLSPFDDGLLRRWEPPASGVAKHRGYAFQWYALGALIVAITVTLGWRHLRSRGRQS
ncbi:MAG TPA: SURF1 family protein [Burkholderiaceae bacterium]|nr:SURF1 family protein [Burkholderiaceae bacterium]